MNNLDKQYTALLQDILDNGVKKGDRTGVGTLSVFGRQIRHKMSEGFPLLTTKKMYTKGVIAELLWFLRGDTHIKFLHDNDCHIWDGDLYKAFFTEANSIKEGYEAGDILGSQPHIDAMFSDPEPLIILTQDEFIDRIKEDEEFSESWGYLGPIYGKQWRNWGERKHDSIDNEYFIGVDQIAEAISKLKTNPDDRGIIVSAWNVGELGQMVLRPCHNFFQFYTRELNDEERAKLMDNLYGIKKPEDRLLPWLRKDIDEAKIPTRAISLMWNQRSVDTFLGLPFNIASYGLLLEIIAEIVNMVPDEIVGTLGDTHLYLNHLDQAREQIGRDLTPEERYNRWFDLNYETGMERFYDPEKLPDYDNEYYEPTPARTREPFQLPTLNINTEFWPTESGECGIGPLDVVAVINSFKDNHFCKCLLEEDIQLSNYKSHPTIKAPLNN
jgi:thymidylate synthase